MKIIMGLVFASTIGVGGMFSSTPSVSAADLQPVHTEHVDSFHLQLNLTEEFPLSGRSIDVLFGDTSAVTLKRHIISFTKPGTYVVKVNGCISDEYYTFVVGN
ncbi:hypothetical protein [Bacillus sp. FDAARGOS_1420]|uniref:hypothetical protein n=1 Tax=Bacillus sp. FDAARGOS_1420 TaxID=2856338 RepID=UPI00214BC459|nr:hypothetical protein [Bacillus sp. FDAARGOS_1420]